MIAAPFILALAICGAVAAIGAWEVWTCPPDFTGIEPDLGQ